MSFLISKEDLEAAVDPNAPAIDWVQAQPNRMWPAANCLYFDSEGVQVVKVEGRVVAYTTTGGGDVRSEAGLYLGRSEVKYIFLEPPTFERFQEMWANFSGIVLD